MPVSEAKTPARTPPGDPALVARGLVAGRRGGPGHRGYRLRLAPRRSTIVGLLGVLAGAVLWPLALASAGDLTGREYWGD